MYLAIKFLSGGVFISYFIVVHFLFVDPYKQQMDMSRCLFVQKSSCVHFMFSLDTFFFIYDVGFEGKVKRIIKSVSKFAVRSVSNIRSTTLFLFLELSITRE